MSDHSVSHAACEAHAQSLTDSAEDAMMLPCKLLQLQHEMLFCWICEMERLVHICIVCKRSVKTLTGAALCIPPAPRRAVA